MGIWQFMPATARIYGLKDNWWYEQRHDPLVSSRAAVRYLAYLHNRFNKNIIGLIENMSENFKLGQSIVESKNLKIHFHEIEIVGVLPRLSKKEIKNVYNNTIDIYKYLPDLS